MHAKNSNRGSLLIVAMLLASIIGISLVSYLKLAHQSSKLANRSFYLDGAQNLVDTGLEQALWSLNNDIWASAGFTARSGHAGEYQATFPSSSTYYDFAGNVKGQVKVWVDSNTPTPHAVAQATITLGDGSTFVKQAEMYMRKRSYFANGLVAKDTLNFVGNVRIDSWVSNADTDSTADDVAYSAGVANDRGQIASLRTTIDSDPSISIGNADVYGYAAIGTSNLSDLQVGATGRLGPYGTVNGVVDTSRVTYDFTTNFPDVSAPTTAGYAIAAINNSKTLPESGHTPAADGKYYYTVPSINLAGNNDLTITQGTSVVLTVTGTSGTTVSITGNAEINIEPASSGVSSAKLELYASANVTIAGNGVMNGSSGSPNSTTAFQIYGTRTAADVATAGYQSIAVKGNGFLAGIVYAPNANVTVNGNGDTYGAIVANRISMNGNGNFHYDESLANLSASDLWSVSKWRELTTSTERTAYATELSF